MAYHSGKWFYPNQGEMLASAPVEESVAIYIKFGTFQFTWFESMEVFWEWYVRAREECSRKKQAFSVYELLRTGRQMCFIADLEVYCPPKAHWTQLQKIEYTIKNPRDIFCFALFSKAGGSRKPGYFNLYCPANLSSD